MSKSAAKKKKKPAPKPVASKKPKIEKKAPTVKVEKTEVVAQAAKPITMNATGFEIETDAYFPPRTRNGKASIYPFAALAIGQSFFISSKIDASIYKDATEADTAQKEESHRVANRMAGATRRFTKRNEGFKFSVRTLHDPEKGHGVRVKRVEISAA